ncbi:hypothetical protein CALCODRAFT_548749 [Calocera cornea HHB12733]|uniref:uS12 prolyl 3,4-dihydroxylase n=1 Tax=Calocera cornea HHB12733 TaxID=1353952 RepID=A0A165K726_9BASI|nr:hypothetical protein CALCODRAFT_548749 [Calocera cornea HHB12733]
MPTTRPRPSSPDHPPAPKRQRLDSAPPAATAPTQDEDATTAFVPHLFHPHTVAALAQAYEDSEPYKHAVLDALVDDELLSKVKDEIIGELRFAEKETDIYKVHQTGDLASLNYLTPAQRALFPSLLRLRNALYSAPFRQFMRAVTGCGPLSGTKQDMSANSYRQGCHLLNHDDVIGSRRVSYILYLPLAGAGATGWKDEWGGALELYPVSRRTPTSLPEPAPIPTKRIPPAWNQFVFFEVQPGHSFHSVEEVVVGLGEDGEGRQRLSISGWFHMAQEGEEGYELDRKEDRTERLLSSLEQLSASAPAALTPYPSPPAQFIPSTPLTEHELTFLSTYLNPVYLQPRSLLLLADQFAQDSSLNLKDFLCEALAEKLDAGLRARDAADGLGPERAGQIPAHSAGVGEGWELQGPPHKHRYLSLSASPSPSSPLAAAADPLPQDQDGTDLLRSLSDDLLPSAAFRAWLGLVTSLVPLSHQVLGRRFRPGLDYTLAQAEEGEARLDVTLCLTPQPAPTGKEGKGKGRENGKGKGKQRAVVDGEEGEGEEGEVGGWASCAWGGWECYMAPHEGEEDPAVYRSGSGGGKANGHANGHANGSGKGVEDAHVHEEGSGDVPGVRGPDEEEVHESEDEDAEGEDDDPAEEGGLEIAEEDREAYEEALAMEEADRQANGGANAEEEEEEEGEEDDGSDDEDETGTLLTAPASFNGLLMVLRDPKLMRFVKYVSAAAEGSRWDVCGEWQVGDLQEDDGEDE